MTQLRPIVHVVDDDPIILEEVREVLVGGGYRAELYGDADSFLDKVVCNLAGGETSRGIPKIPGMLAFRRPPPQCLILDVRMPGLSGLGLQRKLDELHFAIPIVFLTGHVETSTVVEAVKLGACDFLEKPVHKQTLLLTVQDALDKDAEQVRHSRQAARLRGQLESLSARELDVLKLLLAGRNTKELAAALDVGLQTVAKHRARILEKLAARTVVDLVRRICIHLPELIPHESTGLGKPSAPRYARAHGKLESRSQNSDC